MSKRRKQKSIGICLGASHVKVVELERNHDAITVTRTKMESHGGDPRDTLNRVIKEMGIEPDSIGAITGRTVSNHKKAQSITEPEAIEQALAFHLREGDLDETCDVLISMGAESFIAYLLSASKRISAIETGNKCASGTGEFFLQQLARMNVTVDRALDLAEREDAYKVSGRCSVFCKSDCTHALNKGIPIGRVVSGLGEMMAERAFELLEKVDRKKVIAVGGVTRNEVVMKALEEQVDRLHVPQTAAFFEALGAAYYALGKGTRLDLDDLNLFGDGDSTFGFLPPLKEAEGLVAFSAFNFEEPRPGDECVVGLDVGSTTTKAVVLRTSDSAVLASEYLRTNGDPVGAARRCYESLSAETPGDLTIVGLGVTGSGRHIAGLHASTKAVINEIIAHATGAAYFSPDVDTIFEIGGQDAKYTHLTNGVPTDYAMNEACSAGTGSFLEESAGESLKIGYTEIEAAAISAKRPPNFNDQCAAFISSDMKTAANEGIQREDIAAGLVYSVCMNYVNRVKGQRPVGAKVFMQGGVCYNRAVPLAMANLLKRPIVVPPEPGLIGAFGVALEVRSRIANGLLEPDRFVLADLASTEIAYGKPFFCKGGKERCDRKCEISVPIVGGRKIPFGGSCDRYYNKRLKKTLDSRRLDHVKTRQEWLFARSHGRTAKSKKKVGISRSYLTHSLYPLYAKFFDELGLEVVLSDRSDPDGQKKRRSSFCYPGELAHGFFSNLLKKNLDYIFLPKVMGLAVENGAPAVKEHQSTCVLLQSEAYYLKSAFKNTRTKAAFLTPVLDFTFGLGSCEEAFLLLGREIGASGRSSKRAYRLAVIEQKRFDRKIKALGRSVLKELEKDPTRSAVVLFGRPYNAFAGEANMGIAAKFGTRGDLIIPWDCLPFEHEHCDKDMCWAMGQNLLKAASFVSNHPQLFGAFVTNFSCGPDSFLLGYFREIMKDKPSLTLELDSHTADAGINTRIDAFRDIVDRYRKLGSQGGPPAQFTPAKIEFHKNEPFYISSSGEKISFFDGRIRMVIPSMGALSSEALAAAFRGIGVRSEAIPVYDMEDLRLGRGVASCKECLPLLLTTGGLLKYLKKRKNDQELTAYFMPFTPGNCRFSQYRVFLGKLIRKKELRNVAIFSLNAEDGYGYRAFTGKDRLGVLKSFIVADVMEDIRNALKVLATDRGNAMTAFGREWERITRTLSDGNVGHLYPVLEEAALSLRKIPLKYPLSRARKVALMGEVFVRRDDFSCRDLMERLAERDIVVKKAHFFEWLKYVDTMVKKGVYDPNFDLKGRVQFTTKLLLQERFEKKIKGILSKSGLYEYELIDIEKVLDYGKNFFDIKFRGESILVVGGFFKDILHAYDGVISVGPFACMPTRVIEAVLSAESTLDTKVSLDQKVLKKPSARKPEAECLPFLSVECDGNPFPQIVEARIEAFCLQVERARPHDQLNPARVAGL